MDDRFDQEFYQSAWQHVLPLGPYGIQPYIRNSRRPRLLALPSGSRRLIAILGRAAQGMTAFGRFAALGIAKRPPLLETRPRVRQPRLRLAQAAAGERGAASPLSEAA